jgi:hypothetical protein
MRVIIPVKNIKKPQKQKNAAASKRNQSQKVAATNTGGKK